MMNQNELKKAVQGLQGHRILVIGDLGLDEYVTGTVKRISPEAPVPVVEVQSNEFRLGLATNVSANIAGLKSTPLTIGVIGNDSSGQKLKELMLSQGCPVDHLIVDEDRPTTRKLRVMSGQYHIVRVDYEKRKFLSQKSELQLIQKVEALMPQCEAVILEDYAKGVLSQKVIESVVALAKKNGKRVGLDPNKQTPVEMYKGVDFMTPNSDEAIALSSMKFDDLRTPSETLEEVGQKLLQLTQSEAVVITRGKDGMSAFEKNGPHTGMHIPTFARSVFDVTGAGDTAIATMTLALASGLKLQDACLLANYASGVAVGRVGCVYPTPAELQEYIQTHV